MIIKIWAIVISIYYLIAFITLLLFIKEKLVISSKSEKLNKRYRKYHIIFWIIYSIAWPVTLILVMPSLLNKEEK